MKQILLAGAGRSASYLIKYLIDHAEINDWHLNITDYSEQNIILWKDKSTRIKCFVSDVTQESVRSKLVAEVDLVISMLPAHMHIIMVKECLKQGKNLITASYLSPELMAFNEEAKDKGLLFLYEMGLDPGIDHMSAMECIDGIINAGGKVRSFKSYCGGLIAPESNDNCWDYKFTWNPRNVVLAGQGTAKYLKNDKHKYLPYQRLFKNTDEVEMDGLGKFDAYPNRDSLSYQDYYNLGKVHTLIRGTLRVGGFCEAWDVFVQLGMTDDSYIMDFEGTISTDRYLDSFLPEHNGLNLKERFVLATGINQEQQLFEKFDWLGLFENTKIPIKKASPAQILQFILENKWKLKEDDKDMVVMQHQFEYEDKNGESKQLFSSLCVYGENSTFTAMAKTVGLPVAIAANLVLDEKIKLKGCHIPVSKELYLPILKELKTFGIEFKETII